MDTYDYLDVRHTQVIDAQSSVVETFTVISSEGISTYEDGTFVRQLDALGAEGWELVTRQTFRSSSVGSTAQEDYCTLRRARD